VLTNPANGEGCWTPGPDNILHRGFGQYSYVFADMNGVIYGLRHGALLGRVIYTGGNGMYERVEYDAAGGFVLHRHERGHRWTWREQGLPESQVLGVAYDSYSYMEMYPYVVTADHPFLEGTGLAVGDRFGETGYNFAASGREVDTRAGAGPEAPGVVQFAQGEQAHGAGMCVLPKPDGGWVFSASSPCFNGALAHDPKMSRILLNAVNAAQLPQLESLHVDGSGSGA
jgi:N,N-dimethylformamidase